MSFLEDEVVNENDKNKEPPCSTPRTPRHGGIDEEAADDNTPGNVLEIAPATFLLCRTAESRKQKAMPTFLSKQEKKVTAFGFNFGPDLFFRW